MHRLTTPATALAVSVADAKAYSGVSVNDDDTLIEQIIREATQVIENRYGLAVMSQTWQLTLNGGWTDPDYWRDGAIHIPRPPFGTITSVAYLDADGVSQTLASTEYRLNSAPLIATIEVAKNKTWPTTYGVSADVTITHTAGVSSASDVPYVVQAAIRDFTDYRDSTRGQGFTEGNSIINRGLLSLLDTVMDGEGILLYG